MSVFDCGSIPIFYGGFRKFQQLIFHQIRQDIFVKRARPAKSCQAMRGSYGTLPHFQNTTVLYESFVHNTSII